MRVLIATVTAGGGHLAAAAALHEAWQASRPHDVIERLDVLTFFSPLHRKMHSNGYVQLVERAPELWGLLFKTTDNLKTARLLNRLKRAIPGSSRLRQLIRFHHNAGNPGVSCSVDTTGCQRMRRAWAPLSRSTSVTSGTLPAEITIAPGTSVAGAAPHTTPSSATPSVSG